MQNRQSPATTLNANSVTKHLSSLSLEPQKKATASPEFVPGRGLTGSNSSSPNLFTNSYHSQENVGGTTYFYVGNAATESVANDEIADPVRKPSFFSSFSLHHHFFLLRFLYENNENNFFFRAKKLGPSFIKQLWKFCRSATLEEAN